MAVHYDTFVQEDEEITPPAAILPPTDDGKEANLVLLGCSILQLPIWGTFIPVDLKGGLTVEQDSLDRMVSFKCIIPPLLLTFVEI